MADHRQGPGPGPAAIELALPFRGRWMARNSPARRVPSHGTHLMGTTYAIDFIPLDADGSPAPRTWRSLIATEPPEDFPGFGRPVLAPADGTVVLAHDGEADHEARRSQPALLGYALTQASRVRAGAAAIAGNHVVLSLGPRGPYVLVAHLRRGSVRVRPGDAVRVGDAVGGCGNSGNSTQPHVHVQVTDSLDWALTRGLPMTFRHPRAGARPEDAAWMPAESEVVDAG
ncbi:M23 family metallopeptidase [Agromyces arachidis]|uniref:M23 family metallopeptidase n=1 Tax=Agromyces arachidis TaxID=766966 RepID=UPI0040568B2E